jgi:hypothetical protein
MHQTTAVSVPVTRQRVVQKDGRKLVETFTTYMIEQRQEEYRVKWDKTVRMYDTDGKPVDPKAVAKRLARETPVLLSADGKKVDPFYLQVMKKDTLVLVMSRGTELPARRPTADGPPRKLPK